MTHSHAATTKVARPREDSRRTARALAESEARFRDLVEQSLVGIYIIQDGRFAYANPRLAELLGYSTDELVASRSALDHVVPEDRATVQENLRRRLSGEVPTLQYRFRLLRRDGTAIEVEVRGTRVAYGGRPAIIETLLDITEQRRAEDELRRSEKKFRTLFRAAADAIVLISPNGDILDVNPAGEMIFGESPGVLGRGLSDFLSGRDADTLRDYLRDVIRGATVEEPLEIEIETSEKGRRLVAIRSRYVRDGATDAYVEMVARDVTDQRNLLRRLVESERQASMGQMAAYVAHEINTPLANISLLTAGALRGTSEPGIVEKLEKINVQRRRAASIISDLLSFSRQREIQLRSSDLGEAIRAASEQVESARQASVTLRLDLPPDLDPAWMDPFQMQEVVANLLKNSYEATTAGTVRVVVEADASGHRISVSDTGSGIPKESFGRIFEPFFTTKRKSGGTGLGLVFCRSVVTAHGGEIRVESEEGKGTTFTIHLPRRSSDEGPHRGR